jgi:hypothetical protein
MKSYGAFELLQSYIYGSLSLQLELCMGFIGFERGSKKSKMHSSDAKVYYKLSEMYTE